MTKKVERISLWKNSTSPVYEVGPGKLSVKSDHVRIMSNKDKFDDAGCEYRPDGYIVMASTSDGVIYDGEVFRSIVRGRFGGNSIVLKCDPAEVYD
jgi:hypothetical protein